MTQQESDIVNKLWGYCNVLKADGMHYGDYIEQLTYLLFLKMADERGAYVPEKYKWNTLLEHSGTDLLDHYSEMLKELGKQEGVLGDIFSQSNNKFRNPVNLSKLILLINENDWGTLDIDVKGTAYEGLLAKFAADQKGAGQYFTPRELIKTIVECVDPKHNETIHDPACGTGGFLIGAFEHIFSKLEKENKALSIEEQDFLQKKAISGGEIVWDTRRLCIMNLYLHDIEANIRFGDALEERYGSYDVIVTNPPFGKKSGGSKYTRDDFTVQTSNKQLNFLQHCMSILKLNGRCAMVMPDGVLSDESEGKRIKELLFDNYNVHTILRLPDGVFTPYAAGVKTNVIFFEKSGKRTEEIWIYDMRTNVEKITKTKGLTKSYFRKFIDAFSNRNQESDRWKKFSYNEIKERNFNLDIALLEKKELSNTKNLPDFNDIYSNFLSDINEIEQNLKAFSVEMSNIPRLKNLVVSKKELSESKYFTIIMGQSPSSKFYNKEGKGLPFFQGKKEFTKRYPETVVWSTEIRKVAEEGDILLSVRAPVGDTNIAKEKSIIGRGLCAIRSNKEYVNQEYLYQYFKYIYPILSGEGSGSTFNAINKRHIESIEIPIVNLEKQIEIAASIRKIQDILDSIEDNMKKNSKIKSLRYAALRYIFEV